MIHTGLVSITFRKLTPVRIIELVQQAGLDGIEWGGDVHVPHGDVDKAKQIVRQTRDAGLTIPAYGSYYRTGVSEDQGLAFQAVLDSAVALKTNVIRVWASDVGTDKADDTAWNKAVEDSQRIADMAAAHDITIAYEYHGNTLTDTFETAQDLLRRVSRPNVQLYWQPRSSAMPTSKQAKQLRQLMPVLSHIHVFSWTFENGSRQVHPLAQGRPDWSQYFSVLQEDATDRYAMLEFVKDDSPEQFLEDAATLREWLNAQ